MLKSLIARYEASRVRLNAIAKLPDDLRTIPIDESGRKILVIPCGDQRAIIINAGRI